MQNIQNMQNVYMIHEVNNEVINYIEKLNSDSLITFDDALVTQYIFKDFFKRFKRVIFFANPTILCQDIKMQKSDFIICSEAHKKAFNNNFENYMTLEQLKDLESNFEIGSHFQNHKYFKSIKEMIENAELSLDFFNNNNIKIKSFCLPYNQDSKNPLLITAFKNKFKDFEIFGSNRIPLYSNSLPY